MNVNRVPKPFLDFDDPGASDEEPVKGVTVGDIRAWHDQYEDLLASWAECRDLLTKERIVSNQPELIGWQPDIDVVTGRRWANGPKTGGR